MDNSYEFIGHWQDADKVLPLNATRCLVTDGELIIIATYIADSPESSHWMFQGLTDGKEFNVIGWMDLPRPMKKPVVISAITQTVNTS